MTRADEGGKPMEARSLWGEGKREWGRGVCDRERESGGGKGEREMETEGKSKRGS